LAKHENDLLLSQRKQPFIEAGDVDAALRTAAAIGDDTLQKPRAGPRGARQFHPRHLRAAQTLVRRRLQGGNGGELQHVCGDAALGVGPLASGTGAMPGIDETRQFVPLKFAVLTVSDTRELADDKVGYDARERNQGAGHVVAERAIVTDDVKEIRAPREGLDRGARIDVIITTGGTGFTGRDVTPEAIEPLFEKRNEGFAALVPSCEPRQDRHLGDPTRATAGVAGATYILLPAAAPRVMPDAGTRICCSQLDLPTYRPAISSEIMPRLRRASAAGKAKGATG